MRARVLATPLIAFLSSAILLFPFVTPALGAESKVKIAVLDLQANGVDKSLAAGATSLLASELSKLDIFRVISRDDIRSMLSFEKDRQSLGCEANEECLAEIGGALGVDYTVGGSLAKAGDAYVLSLTLSNTKTSAVENRVTENIAKQDQVVKAVAKDARALVAKILTGRQGFLVLSCAEPGASVKIDGAIRGNTPLAGRLPLAWGPHLLEVEKTGFVAYSEDISIPNKQVLAKNVALVPSTDFIEAYHGRAGKMRTGAWITSGIAVAGIGAAIVFNQLSSSTEQTFQSERSRFQSGDQAITLAELNSLSSKGSNEVLIARIALGAGVVSAAIATWLWVAGDDPHKYDGYRDSAPGAAVPIAISAVPAPRGGAVAMQGSF